MNARLIVSLYFAVAVTQTVGKDAGVDSSDSIWSSGAQADPVIQLPFVLVTATRSEQKAFRLPFAVNEVSQRQIEQNLPRTTPEALKETPSVMVQKTAHGQGSPFIRGFTGFRTQMLIDGIRLNNSVFRDGPNQYWNTVDTMSVERSEVVNGPSSVLTAATPSAAPAVPRYHPGPFL